MTRMESWWFDSKNGTTGGDSYVEEGGQGPHGQLDSRINS